MEVLPEDSQDIYSIKPWFGTFADSSVEKKYKQWEMELRRESLTRYTLTGVFLNLAFLYTDWGQLGLSTDFFYLLVTRIVTSLVGLIFLFTTRFAKSVLYFDLIIMLGLFSFAIGINFAIYFLGGENIEASGFLLVIIAFYLFFQLRLSIAIFVGVVSSVLFLLLSKYVLIDFYGKFDVVFASFVITNFFCLLTIKEMHRQKRKEFSEIQTENTINVRLESENNKRKKIERELEKLARLDYLTGCVNRKAGLTELQHVMRDKHGSNLSVAILDIDHFKKINDQKGHLVGDKALVLLANLLKSNVSSAETVVRIGGEEFLIIMPEKSIDEAREKCEFIRNLIQQKTEQEGIPLTCSFGVAQLQVNNSLDDLMARADQVLYQAKSRGRNRVITSE